MDKFSCVTKIFGVLLFLAMAAITLPAQTFTTVQNFDGTNGSAPSGGMLRAENGSLYGTTAAGGSNGDGTIFKITPQGALVTVHNFDGADGAHPYSTLVQGTDGAIYGTTNAGGKSTACTGGCGTIFKITGDTLKTLHSFEFTDGAIPQGGLIQATDGNFWGTTVQGGPGCEINVNGCGTAFKITPMGQLTTVHDFAGKGDGGNSYSGLVQARNGNFYGTTFNGGANGKGTIFKVTLSGGGALVYPFCSQPGCADGANPMAGMVEDPQGNLYGTTTAGGNTSCSVNGSAGCGVAFIVTLGAAMTTLHAFDGSDGAAPVARMVLGNDGVFFGTTPFGGANNSCGDGCGTLFDITAQGNLTTLYSFCSQSGCADGERPYGGLLQNTDGTFYGTTPAGGTNGDGTVFNLSEGLDPFVEANPPYGMIGTSVEILGTNLIGATSVTFNGTTATFKVLSYFLIETHVPTGATTGSLQVETPSGLRMANFPFKVIVR